MQAETVQALMDPARHEPLCSEAWSDDGAHEALCRIVQALADSFTPQGLWPLHPRDDEPADAAPAVGLYYGAAGNIWALQQLAGAADGHKLPDFSDTVADLTARQRRSDPLPPDRAASFFIGDSGTLLLHWQATRERALADRLYAVVQGNLDHPSQEALWGNPGTLAAAIHMAEATSEARWPELIRQGVQRLVQGLHADPDTGTPVWTQDMGTRKVRYLGAGHGLVGNVYLALRAAAWLTPSQQHTLLDAALQTLQATALRDGSGALNWHPLIDPERVKGRLPSVQDCHGAPGVLNRLCAAPRSEAWDELLQGAAELTWRAGPLSKGPGLCHGTAGSALALLKFAQRVHSPLWRDRGRALAWHAWCQVQAQWAAYGRCRPGLWTGDPGVAWVLRAGLGDEVQLPLLDVF